jgi:hypothetical protein
MKTINNKLFQLMLSVLVMFCLLTISSCGKKDDPSATEVNTGLLSSGTWKISSVVVDGTDRTSLFTGMTLQFQAGSYTTSNGGVVWPASGSWSFIDTNALSIKRSDDVTVTINTISETNLVLSLAWSKTTLGKGRVSSFKGQHVFSFTK